VNEKLATPPLLAVVVLAGDVVPSPQFTVALRELPGGVKQLSVAVTGSWIVVVVGVTDRAHANPTTMLIG
jgi:hypothetical protein